MTSIHITSEHADCYITRVQMLPVRLRMATEERNQEQGKNKGVPELQEPLLGRTEKTAKARGKG
jgi:hypothetical protein